MKQYFRMVFICCSLIVMRLQAQDWIKVNPVFDPPGNYNTHIGCFVDSKHCWWLSGPNRYAWFTSDGGMNWSVQKQGGKASSYIQFIDTLYGWLGGETLPEHKYYITTTKDGGKTWNEYSTPVIFTIAFLDSLNGFAGGDSIYATTDGGETWKTQILEPLLGSIGIYDIYFIDRKHGWAVGGGGAYTDNGIILNTVDSGKTWQYNNPETTVGKKVYFTDTLHGYTVGSNPPFFEGVVQVTSDGGVTWNTQYLPCTWLRDIAFTDDSTGWVVGDYGFIWHTTDSGMNWTQIESGTTSHLYRIFFFDDGKIGYILGTDSTLLKHNKIVNVEESKLPSPLSLRLSQNYPNPFNPTTQIEFQIPGNGLVSLKIYDLLGKEVITLLSEEKKRGNYTVRWNGKDKYGMEVSSGIYYYQMRTGFFSQTRKMIFIK